MSTPPSTAPAGWFPDPVGRHDHRYFNGSAWTADVSDAGVRAVDPFGIAAGGIGQISDRNRIATASLVCGLIGLFLAWIPFICMVGICLAVLALVFGVKGVRRSRRSGIGRRASIVGIASSGMALLLSVYGVAFSVTVYRAVDAFINPGPVNAVVTSCERTEDRFVIIGEITNLGTTTSDYTVFGWVTEPANEMSVDLVTDVASVPPNETLRFELTQLRVGQAGSCEAAVDVQGPTPFGIKIPRIED